MSGSLALHSMATSSKARVAVGLDPAQASAEKVLNSTLFACRERYIQPVLVSSGRVSRAIDPEGVAGSEIPMIIDESAEGSLVSLLKEGVVEAAIRGNLSSKKVVPLLRSEFSCPNLCRTSVLEIGGRLVMLAPVGIDEGETRDDLIKMASNGRKVAGMLGIPYQPAVLSGGRLEDRGRSPKVDRMLSEAESLTGALNALGHGARNYGIEIERAVDEGATLLMAPDGIFGNVIFRSLVLVANIESFGAYATALPRIFIDTSRAKESYLLPLILASALSKK